MSTLTFVWPYEGSDVSFACSDNWDEKRAMEQVDGKWTVQMDLWYGKYEYKFIVDGNWYYDIMEPTTDDGYGGKNNVVVVTAVE